MITNNLVVCVCVNIPTVGKTANVMLRNKRDHTKREREKSLGNAKKNERGTISKENILR